MILGNLVKAGRLKKHPYSQCYFANCSTGEDGILCMQFISYNSVIFWVQEMPDCLIFRPTLTSPGYSPTTARQTLWALQEFGYNYNQAHIIIDELRKGKEIKV